MVQRIRRKLNDIERKQRKKITELEAEILIAVVFAAFSGLYIANKYGNERMFDTLMFWIFPASVTIILTLAAVLIWEIVHDSGKR